MPVRPRRPLVHPDLAAGEPPRIACVVQHTASRAHLLGRLVTSLGDGWHGDVQIVEGDEPGNPWTTYRACLDLANAWSLDEQADAPTHMLVVQDDVLPVERLAERTTELVARRPVDVLCLYTPQNPAYMGRAIHAAFGHGHDFATLPTGMFTPVVATLWPLADAQDILVWWETAALARQRRSDDAQVARWLRARRRFALAAVPCLVDHDESEPSTLGLGRYRRHAALMAPQA